VLHLAGTNSEADIEMALTLLLDAGALPTDLSLARARTGVPTCVGAAVRTLALDMGSYDGNKRPHLDSK
jgi:hypothetical protein